MASMDLMALLSTIVLVATIATTIFAVGAYIVSRGYTRRIRVKASLLSKKDAPAPTARLTPILRRYNPYTGQ